MQSYDTPPLLTSHLPGCRVHGLLDLLEAGLLDSDQHPPLGSKVEADLIIRLKSGQKFVESVVKIRLLARATGHRLPAVQSGLLKQHEPDIDT